MTRFFRERPRGAALLLVGLVWTGWPDPAQALSLFSGGDEPQQPVPAPPPPAQAAGGETKMPKPAAGADATATPPVTEALGEYTYDPKSRRDPFQSLANLLKGEYARAELPPLQRVPLSDLKLQGIMWGASGYYGSLRTPDGKSYTVKEGMRIGMNNGVIAMIRKHAIMVSEPSLDITGNQITKEIEILLRPQEVNP